MPETKLPPPEWYARYGERLNADGQEYARRDATDAERLENVRTGALQRIADSLEIIARDRVKQERTLENYKHQVRRLRKLARDFRERLLCAGLLRCECCGKLLAKAYSDAGNRPMEMICRCYCPHPESTRELGAMGAKEALRERHGHALEALASERP